MLRDPKHLWSAYGLRSLSASHPEFGKGENYWKGPIWIQMNYLALGALYKTYGAQEGPYRERANQIYGDLRKNVIDNVFKVSSVLVTFQEISRFITVTQEYERTGYVWEQYDALTGEGRRRLVNYRCYVGGMFINIHFFCKSSFHRLDVIGLFE